MQPFEHFASQLLQHTPRERVSFFSCGHIIPPDHVTAMVLPLGPTNVEFEFTVGRRSDPALIEELGRVVLNMCSIVPAGVIVFFPSYKCVHFYHFFPPSGHSLQFTFPFRVSYEAEVCKQWEATGMLKRMAAKKHLFREPRNGAETDAVLAAYTACINVDKQGNVPHILRP